MLRAVGMTQVQVRRMIRHESVVTSLIGAALGIPIGIALAALFGQTIGFFVVLAAVGQLIVFLIAAMIAGILAAIFPARRASRLNVLAGAPVRVTRGAELLAGARLESSPWRTCSSTTALSEAATTSGLRVSQPS